MEETVKPKSGCGSYLFLTAIISTGLVFLIGSAVYFALRSQERVGAALVNTELEKLKKQGLPVDDFSLESWYRSRTSNSDSNQWVTLLDEFDTPEFRNRSKGIPLFDGTVVDPEETKAGTLPYESRYREFLEATSEMRDSIHTLAQSANPIQFPLKFQSWNTELKYLIQVRNVARYLTVEFELALFDKDFNSVRKSIESQLAFTNVISEQPSMVSGLVLIACRGIALGNLKKALEADILDRDALKSILDKLRSLPSTQEMWNTIIESERAFGLSEFDAPDKLQDTNLTALKVFGVSSFDKLQYLQLMEQANRFDFSSLDQVLESAEGLEQSLKLNLQNTGLWGLRHLVLTSQLMPAMSASVSALVRDKMMIEKCDLAIRLRIYDKNHGHFPPSLDELEAEWPSKAGRIFLGGKPLGYRVEPTGAKLWGVIGYSYSRTSIIPAEPPSLEAIEPNQRDSLRDSVFDLRK